MKNLNEYKAEILLRSEKRIKAKRERRIKTFAVVLPLCAALVFGGIIMLPEMLFVGFDGAKEEAETGTTENADGAIGQLFRFTSFTVSGDTEYSVDDPDKAADAYFAISSTFVDTDGGDLNNEYNDNRFEEGTDNESSNTYFISFKATDGEVENYRISENRIYNLSSGAETTLSDNQLNEIYKLLGVIR